MQHLVLTTQLKLQLQRLVLALHSACRSADLANVSSVSQQVAAIVDAIASSASTTNAASLCATIDVASGSCATGSSTASSSVSSPLQMKTYIVHVHAETSQAIQSAMTQVLHTDQAQRHFLSNTRGS